MNKTGKFILLQACNSLTMIGSSLITPFFPPFAIEKGISQSILGFMIAASPIGSFFVSLILGKNITENNRFKFIMIGLGLQAISLAMFVLLYWVEQKEIIIGVGALSRLVGGVGTACFMTPFYAYIPMLYPLNVEKMIGISEFISGASQLIGPVFGSFLFGLGGYILPFMVFCCCDFAILPMLAYGLPDVRPATRGTNVNPVNDSIITDKFIENESGTGFQFKSSNKKIPYSQVMTNYPVFMQFMMVFACNICFTFFQPIIAEFYLDQYGINEETVGYLMSIVTAGYSIGSYLVGHVKEKKRQVVCFGVFIFGASYLFVGPDEGLTGIKHHLWITLTSQLIMGISTAPVYIPAVPLLNEILELKYPDNHLETSNIASAIFTSGMSLGQLTGPIASGIAADHLGFDRACGLLGIFLIFLGICYIPMLFLELGSQTKSSDKLGKLNLDGIRDNQNSNQINYDNSTVVASLA